MRRIDPRDDTGASAAEYSLLVAGIAALVVAILFGLGGTVVNVFDRSCDSVRDKVSPSSTHCQ